jgi:predicted nuclease of restriction endonuclease-like (RecB) superfamily
MRKFYLAYRGPILPPLVAEISWSHHRVLLDKCKDPKECGFYIQKTREFGWSKDVLIHQIEYGTYKHALAGQTNFNRTLPAKIHGHLKHAVKDEYTFDFLELNDEYNEKQLELAILAKVQPFLREMGGIFSFVGSQFRLEIKGREYFIDILLYHRHLRCLVAIELKVGEFVPEYVGKVQFYLAALDSQVKTREENPSIGIILCKSKERTIVEYALRESKKPIGVATYRVLRKLPKKLRKELPRPQQVEMLLDALPAKTLATGERK